jgi:hypothetical protein
LLGVQAEGLEQLVIATYNDAKGVTPWLSGERSLRYRLLRSRH